MYLTNVGNVLALRDLLVLAHAVPKVGDRVDAVSALDGLAQGLLVAEVSLKARKSVSDETRCKVEVDPQQRPQRPSKRAP